MLRYGLIIVVLVFATVQSVQSAQTACSESRTERGQYRADIIRTTMYYTVYLPPCYDESDRDYPVIYLMHGSNDDDGQWGRLGLYTALDEGIVSGRYPPLIAVMPFAEWVGNQNQFDAASWGEVFLNQLMPLVENNYRIHSQRESRAIGGISRGGFWAYHIGLRNPDLFSAIGGHSAFFDQYHAPPEFNPLDLARNSDDLHRLRLWLDRGRDDYAAPGLDMMDARLAERGADYTYIVYPEGQHHNSYWIQHVMDYLDFYVSGWGYDSDVTTQPESQVDSASLPLVLQTNTPQPRPTVIVPPTHTPQAMASPAPTSLSPSANTGMYVLLPVVVFPSREANISKDRLETILAGLLDDRLVLAETIAARLAELGVTLAPGTRIIPDDMLYDHLWRNRDRFTLLPFDQLTMRYRVLNVDELHPLDHDVYPLMWASDAPNYFPNRLTRMVMSGVTALTRETVPVLDANGVVWAGEAIKSYVDRADFFHTSNEVSFHPLCPQRNVGEMGAFCSKEAHFELLTYLDLDIVELSGNHNNDYGYDAYRETLGWYDDQGIETIGGGETLEDARTPLLLFHNNNTIAMLACNWVGPYYALVNEDPAATGGARPGAAACDREWLGDVLPRLAAENDVVIVTVQYLEADQFTPLVQQQRDFRQLADWGADVVIGTQAHFPQTFEFYGDSFIHYGLGNLFFDQEFFGGVRFFMDQLFIYEGRLLTIDLFTGIIEDQGRPRPMTSDERLNFLFLMFDEYGGM